MLRVLHEELSEDARHALKREAFGGWLHLLTQPMGEGKKHPSFDKYTQMVGLGGKPTALPSVEEAVTAADATVERVRKAFMNRKAVTKGESI